MAVTVELDYVMMKSSLSCNLQGEVVFDILSQLPIKSLMRFRCVKKSWNSLVKNPFFVQMHASHNSSQPHDNECFLLASRTRRNKRRYDMITELSLIPFESNKWKPLGIHEKECYMIVGSSKGLVCLITYNPLLNNNFMLLNPATRETKSTNVELVSDSFLFRNNKYTTAGFGFDEEHGDFKIVFIVEQGDLRHMRLSHSEAVVYSFNADSWKTVTKPPEYALTVQRGWYRNTSARVELHNKLHWRASKPDQTWVVGRFDLGSESFDRLALPRSQGVPDVHRWRQGEELAVVFNFNNNSRKFEVWTMVRYGDASSWMKELTFRYPDGLEVSKVHCSNRNGDFIISPWGKKKAPVLYLASGENNPEVKDLGIVVPKGVHVLYDVVVYKPSLEHVNGGQSLNIDGSSKIGRGERVCRFLSKIEMTYEKQPLKVTIFTCWPAILLVVLVFSPWFRSCPEPQGSYVMIVLAVLFSIFILISFTLNDVSSKLDDWFVNYKDI